MNNGQVLKLRKEIAALRVVVRPEDERPTDLRLAEFLDNWIDGPVLPVVLERHAERVAQRRFLAEVRDGVAPYPACRCDGTPWWGLPQDDREGRAREELETLGRHQRLLGAEAGWAAWLAEAEGWPPADFGCSTDQAAFDRAYARELEVRANHRRDPMWVGWRRRTGWREGMTFEDEVEFDRGLLERRAAERGAPGGA